MDEAVVRRPRWGPALAALGGSAAVMGSVLTWATVSGRRAGIAVDGTAVFGRLTVGAGLVAVVAGLLLPNANRRGVRALLAAMVLAGGLVAAGAAGYAATNDRVVLDRTPVQQGRRHAARAARRGGATVRIEPGAYLVVAGGLLAAAGGVTGLGSARGRRPAKPEEPESEEPPTEETPAE